MDLLGKEREMNVAPRGNVSFTEVKAVVRSYDWGVPIMVIAQRVRRWYGITSGLDVC